MPRKLTGRFDIQSVVPIDSTNWTITGSFFDETGTFGPSDIVANFRLYAYSSLDNTLRYRITNVFDVTNPMGFDVQWDDVGSPIEPPTGIGAITEVSLTKLLPEEPSFSQQLLDEPLVSGIRAQMNRTLLENFSGGGGGQATKDMVAGMAIAANKPVAKRNDGKIVLAGTSGADNKSVIGFSLASAAGDGSIISVLLIGSNLSGALIGSGIAVGASVYLSETGGYVDTVAGFAGSDDQIFKLGIADCGDGLASNIATDLIVFPELISAAP